MAALLEIENVSKAFGGLQCINHLDVEVNEGEIVSVIGPNGAGKTTLFNLVTGMYRPDTATSGSTARASSGSRRTRSRIAGSHARSRRFACS